MTRRPCGSATAAWDRIESPTSRPYRATPSDNIPGVRGIGPKHAIRLLTQFGTLEGIYDRVDEVTPVRFQDGAGG